MQCKAQYKAVAKLHTKRILQNNQKHSDTVQQCSKNERFTEAIGIIHNTRAGMGGRQQGEEMQQRTAF